MKYVIGFFVGSILWAIVLSNIKIPEYTIIIDRSNCIQENRLPEERKPYDNYI